MQKLGYILRVRIVLLFHSILIAHIRIAVFLHTVYMPVAEYISGKFMFIYFYLLYLNTLTLYLSSYVSCQSVNISAATWAIVEKAVEPRKMLVE